MLHYQLADGGLEFLTKRCRSLEELSISNCLALTDAGITDLFQKCTKLRTLSFSNAPKQGTMLVNHIYQRASIQNFIFFLHFLVTTHSLLALRYLTQLVCKSFLYSYRHFLCHIYIFFLLSRRNLI